MKLSSFKKTILTSAVIGIIILIFSAIIFGGVIYSNRTNPQLAGNNAPIPMRILINTSLDYPTIGGEIFITGEWIHVSEEWFQKNAEALKEYPDIKEARTILEEKLAGVPEEKMKEVIKENNLQDFAQGLKDASVEYHQPLPDIADKILKITPYVQTTQ